MIYHFDFDYVWLSYRHKIWKIEMKALKELTTLSESEIRNAFEIFWRYDLIFQLLRIFMS